MRIIKPVVLCAALAVTVGQARADVTFTFIESGGNVLMQSSGTLNTANLVPAVVGGWGGTGFEINASPDPNIMGDTSMGGIDVAFGFNVGTNTSAWVSSMFINDNFSWSTGGTTQFTTYNFNDSTRTPGIGIGAEDLIAGLWTPDVSWTQGGTLASIGLIPGTYTITDVVTNEAITIQVGALSAPEPTSLALFGIGVCLAGVARRRRSEK
jgi:hypothetical protein